MAASFELKKTQNGQFYFNLKAVNGLIILTSEMYEQKASAINGIHSVQTNSHVDSYYDRLVAKDGHFYFNLKAANHQVIGSSQMYTSESARDNGIESVKQNGSTQIIDDFTS